MSCTKPQDRACAFEGRQRGLTRTLTTVPDWRYHAARTTPRKSQPGCDNRLWGRLRPSSFVVCQQPNTNFRGYVLVERESV
jgi:hypothetical protein